MVLKPWYALTGDSSLECLFILFGATSRNGKGTTMETFLRIMGDYGKTSNPEILSSEFGTTISSSGPSEEIARLAGVRFVNISEPEKRITFNAALVKRMTGNDTLNARFLHENSFDFKLQKQAPQDYLTKKPKAVTYESYYLHSDHEGIIDRELWEKAKSIIEGRNSDAMQGIHRQRSGHHPLYGHLFCAECGAPFKRRTLTNSCGHYKAWNCAERQKGKNGNGCRNMVWKEEVLTDAVCDMLGWNAFDEKRFEETGLNLKVDGRELAMA